MDDKDDKKAQMESLLESLSEEQIDQLAALLKKSSVTSRNTRKKRRRGKGRRKKREKEERKKSVESSEEPTKEDFTLGLRLTASEREELEEASKFDKEAGVRDAPERPKKAKKSCFVEITCRVCGSTNKVSRGLVPPEATRYKCNTCACSAG